MVNCPDCRGPMVCEGRMINKSTWAGIGYCSRCATDYHVQLLMNITPVAVYPAPYKLTDKGKAAARKQGGQGGV